MSGGEIAHPGGGQMLRIHIAVSSFRASVTDRLCSIGKERSGVTAIEYGLIAGAIAVAIIATVIALGGDIKNLFATTGSALNSVTGSAL
jgi:pilus assembly protein Flp/PilA